MTIQLTDEIKEQLWGAALQVGLDMMAAAASGVEGSIHEMSAMLNAPYELARRFPNNQLIQSLLPPIDAEEIAEETEEEAVEEAVEGEPDITEGGAIHEKGPATIHRETLALMGEVKATLVQIEAGTEGNEYKQWLVLIGEAVALAAREGGFLGIGRKRESRPEHEALTEIAAALGTPPLTWER